MIFASGTVPISFTRFKRLLRGRRLSMRLWLEPRPRRQLSSMYGWLVELSHCKLQRLPCLPLANLLSFVGITLSLEFENFSSTLSALILLIQKNKFIYSPNTDDSHMRFVCFFVLGESSRVVHWGVVRLVRSRCAKVAGWCTHK
jgi:hypothetical protein